MRYPKIIYVHIFTCAPAMLASVYYLLVFHMMRMCASVSLFNRINSGVKKKNYIIGTNRIGCFYYQMSKQTNLQRRTTVFFLCVFCHLSLFLSLILSSDRFSLARKRGVAPGKQSESENFTVIKKHIINVSH